MVSPKLSIITVMYNAESLLGVTLDSIAKVQNELVEYVVVDGLSKDNSLQVLEDHEVRVDTLITEKDTGIYDAMNKGLKAATGEYILFINAGDEVLPGPVASILDSQENADIIYGDALFVDEDRKELGLRSDFTTRPLPKLLSLKSFQMGQAICHQSFAVKRKLTRPYELKYRISSDFDWMLGCIERASSFKNLEVPVSRFLHGGKSKQQQKTALKERFWILVDHFGWGVTLWNHFKIGLRGFQFYLKNRRLD